MTPEELKSLEELLSLEAAPADSLTADQRADIERPFRDAAGEDALTSVGAVAISALDDFGENLRAQFAVALHLEMTGESEEAGKVFHHLARELASQDDWQGARQLALRALPIRQDYRTARILLRAWENLADKTYMDDDIALAESLCPDSPDILWLRARQADGRRQTQDAELLAGDAFNQFIAIKDADAAEEPLLRLLESETDATYARIVKALPRIAQAALTDLLNTTLELATSAIAEASLDADLADALKDIILKRKGFEHLRAPYAAALSRSLGGGSGLDDFVAHCGLADPDVPFEDALERFRDMFTLRPRAFVEHNTFGVGCIDSHDGGFVVIDFADKPGHRMALEIASRALHPLPDGCLRVARFSDPEGIAREIAEDPVSLLARALADLGGQASAREFRDHLAGDAIPEDDWSAWWKRAREAGRTDTRIDTSQAFRQVYRLPTDDEDEHFQLPPLSAKAGPQSATALIGRLLKQHPELEDQAKTRYALELAERVAAASPSESVAALPLLMRWLPDRADQWRAVADAAFRGEPGVAGGVTADQQADLLAIGLQGGAWREAAFSALVSRFPAVRKSAIAALRERLGDEFPSALRDDLWSRRGRPTVQLAIARLGLAGALGEDAPGPWELALGVLAALAGSPPPKLQHALLDLIATDGNLAAPLKDAPLDDALTQQITRVADDLAISETGPQPLVALLRFAGHDALAASITDEDAQEPDPIDIHFDPSVTLMTRATFRQNHARIRDLAHQLATTLPREIGAARELGDLSENAEYHDARERQGIADATLRALQSTMDGARVIEDLHFPDDVAVVGTEVVVRDLADGAERTFWMLGQGDSAQDDGVINYRAPLGQALAGKKTGDTLELETDGNRQGLEVVSITRREP